MKKISTNDPKIAVKALCQQNCNCMHKLADVMNDVMELKRKYDEGEFKSARTPECCDEIMRQLVYIFKCEANCGIAEAAIVADGGSIDVLDYSDSP